MQILIAASRLDSVRNNTVSIRDILRVDTVLLPQ